MFCITSRRYGDNAKQHRFYYIFKLSSVFSICLTGVFYNDNERIKHLVECLNELKLDLFPFQQWKQLLFGHEDNRNCKRSAFICVHNNKK